MIAFFCAGCGKSFQIDDRLAGRRSRCKQCGTVATIPVVDVIPLLEVERPSPIVVTPRHREARQSNLG
jgi:hypothetical protein